MTFFVCICLLLRFLIFNTWIHNLKKLAYAILVINSKILLLLDLIAISIFDLVFSIFPLPAFYLPPVVLMENSSGDSPNSSNDEIDKELNSIISGREKLVKAINNVNPEEQAKALEELQNEYPKKLEGSETRNDFLDKIDKELTSKTEKLKRENHV